ncbi:MAG: HAD family hydrolase [Planctomycetota bacterium]|jgi:phosphoglycolate phosphatase-like HAD superfamily hydrolase
MLILFDIDGTLLLSRHAGRDCFHAAARELFGTDFAQDDMLFPGGLDPFIWRELCARHDIHDGDAQPERFRATYLRLLAERLPGEGTADALPGVMALLDELGGREHVTLGLLTGNFPESGRIKLRAAGVDPERFAVGAFGDDGPDRRALLAVAVERAARTTGRDRRGADVVLVGDTPLDVDCALTHGARCLAVATGMHPAEDLVAAGAHLVLEDLADTQAVIAWLDGRTADAPARDP